MTRFQVSILSSLATFLICWVQFVHAVHITNFTFDDDARFVCPQPWMNPNLCPPEGHKAIAQLYAVGYQHYIYNGTGWLLKNATADLYNARMEDVGVHYFLPHTDSWGGQPSWQTSDLPSLVTAKRNFSQPIENTIAWLLLQTTHSEGNANLFGKVTYIQRLYTDKGLAPASPGLTINATHSSFYTAFYVYYTEI